jgi:hypothetical protein
MATFDLADYNKAIESLDTDHQRVDEAPSVRQRLGAFTVICLVLNRTIGKSSSRCTPDLSTCYLLMSHRLWHFRDTSKGS